MRKQIFRTDLHNPDAEFNKTNKKTNTIVKIIHEL